MMRWPAAGVAGRTVVAPREVGVSLRGGGAGGEGRGGRGAEGERCPGCDSWLSGAVEIQFEERSKFEFKVKYTPWM